MKAAIFDPAKLPYPEDRCAESACNHPRDLHFWSGRKNGERILNCVVCERDRPAYLGCASRVIIQKGGRTRGMSG